MLYFILYCSSLSYFRSDGRSVSQSVRLDILSFWDSWPDSGCSQHSCSFVVLGRTPGRENGSVL